MPFKNNFSKIKLLANDLITFRNEEGDTFELYIPSVLETFTDLDLGLFLELFQRDLSELQEMFPKGSVTSHYSFAYVVLALEGAGKEVSNLAGPIRNAFRLLLKDWYFDKRMFAAKGVPLTEELWDDIIKIVFQGIDRNYLETEKEEDDEFTKAEKRHCLLLQKLKKKKEQSVDDTMQVFEQMCAGILYHFQQFKLKDLFELNLYTFNYLFSQIGKITSYEVNKAMFAAGNTKTLKHFIEK